VPEAPDIDPASFATAHFMGVIAYESARRILDKDKPRRSLTARERECLLYAARGKSDWAISEVLGVSERTVHHAIERAKTRFDAATRVLAIVRAMKAGEFSVDDIVN
jgi:DNA-binding CsgD family transcriptional regulator